MQRTARDVMTREVFTVSPDLPLLELERELATRRIGGAPVVEAGKLVGVVSRSDVDRLIAEGEEPPGGDETYFWAPDLPAAARESITHQDRARVALERFPEHRVRDVMTSRVISVEPDAVLRDVAHTMVDRHIHRLLVVERGALVGLVSTFDLVREMAERD